MNFGDQESDIKESRIEKHFFKEEMWMVTASLWGKAQRVSRLEYRGSFLRQGQCRWKWWDLAGGILLACLQDTGRGQDPGSWGWGYCSEWGRASAEWKLTLSVREMTRSKGMKKCRTNSYLGRGFWVRLNPGLRISPWQLSRVESISALM